MPSNISYKSYRRQFRTPLRTARGEWALREGYIVRIERDGRVGYGEVAPLPEFGTESFAAAGAFLEEWTQQPDLQIPDSFPCCAFAASVASAKSATQSDYAISALLPAGDGALGAAEQKIRTGYASLKWKIGVEPLERELATACQLFARLPKSAKLRFDANASLSTGDLEAWLELLAAHPDQVDYIEQPLTVGEETTMARYTADSGVPIALDESLNGPSGAKWVQPAAWAGPLVVKAPLMGNFEQLKRALEPSAERVVLSSVFETGIGLANSLTLAENLKGLNRAIGFDTLDAFEDALTPVKSGPAIRASDRTAYNPEAIWNLI